MRTKYFKNIRAFDAIKRLANDSLTAPYEQTDSWKPSAYSISEVYNRNDFQQITRQEARKLRPTAFRTPFSKA